MKFKYKKVEHFPTQLNCGRHVAVVVWASATGNTARSLAAMPIVDKILKDMMEGGEKQPNYSRTLKMGPGGACH